jgi:predicted dehydrogenase
MAVNGQRRYAIIGAGSRAEMYVDAILGPHAERAELVALLDTNPTRAQYHVERAAAAGVTVPVFDPADLEQVIRSSEIDRVIITTPDFLHAGFIDRALRAGADVVVEKPLTIDDEGVRRIVAAVRETGREVVVTFNYRYSPRNSALKEVVRSGEIGTVTGVTFEWVLDTAHGADYFRRWHRDKKNSGGLLVHKASHHFDLVNWWIDDVPTRVFVSGGLRFYGDTNARSRGLAEHPARGTHDGPKDPFELDLRHDPRLAKLYLAAEGEDGYFRDQDVFGPGITIEDNISAVVDYERNVSMSYSLTAHSPWEGYRIAINGTKGRVELDVVERAAVVDGEGAVIDPSLHGDESGPRLVRSVGERLVVQTHWSEPREIVVHSEAGGHGGGDALLMRDVFEGPTIEGPTSDGADGDPLGRAATWVDGLRSVAVGIAGNRSLAEGRPITVDELDLGVDLATGADRGQGRTGVVR